MYTDTHMQSQIVWGFQHVGLHKLYDEENLEVLNGKWPECAFAVRSSHLLLTETVEVCFSLQNLKLGIAETACLLCLWDTT